MNYKIAVGYSSIGPVRLNKSGITGEAMKGRSDV